MFLHLRESTQGVNQVRGGIVALCSTTARGGGVISTSGSNLRLGKSGCIGRSSYSHINPYAASHTVVLFQPFFHKIISSILSCNQNKRPTFATNRRKFVVMIGRERGSRVLREVCAVWPAFDGEVEPNIDGAFGAIDAADVGIDDDRSNWGTTESAALDASEAATGLLGCEVECQTVAVDESGKDVSILSAGRTEWLSVSSSVEARRVASAGMSTYSKVAMEEGNHMR